MTVTELHPQKRTLNIYGELKSIFTLLSLYILISDYIMQQYNCHLSHSSQEI